MKTLADITALVLAGGLGVRLRSVVSDRPKALAPIRGRPFLTYLLRQLVDHRIQRAVLCTGFLGDRVQSAFGEAYHGMRLSYSREEQALGTAGALVHARNLIESDLILVLNGDSYCASDFNAFAAAHLRSGANASLLLSYQNDTGRFGQVQLDDRSRIKAFSEKNSAARPGWINAGIYLLPITWVAELPGDRKLSLEREVFPIWIGRGLFGHPTNDAFLDIGTPESYRAASEFFAGLGQA